MRPTAKEVWDAMEEFATQVSGAGEVTVVWQGDLVELALLYYYSPPLFFALMHVEPPQEAEVWQRELVRIARLVQQCVRHGYKLHQQDHHLEVLPKHQRAQALYNTTARLFRWFCAQVRARCNEECTGPQVAVRWRRSP